MSRKLLNEELNRLTTEEYKDAEKLPIVVVLDNVRSLNNIGSVFRTSDAFRLSKIYLCGITATPPHREIHKTALGAEESVDWEYFEETTDAVQALKNEGYTILSVEQVENSISLEQFSIENHLELREHLINIRLHVLYHIYNPIQVPIVDHGLKYLSYVHCIHIKILRLLNSNLIGVQS